MSDEERKNLNRCIKKLKRKINYIVEEHKLNLDGDYYYNLYLESKGE